MAPEEGSASETCLFSGRRSGTLTAEEFFAASGPEVTIKSIFLPVISCIIAVFLFLTGIHMPSPVSIAAKHLSNLAAPLSMMVIGQSMIHIKFKELFGDIRLIVFSLIKLVAIPIVGIFILRLIIHDEMLLNACYIILATPIGSMTAMFAQQYGSNYSLAARGVALSTLMSVLTIPLVALLIGC